MSGIIQSVFMNQRSFGAAPGQQAYTTPGTYSWVAPVGTTSVSVVVVGSGKTSGVGGALSYKNNISVTPGNFYSVFVSSTGSNRSYFCRSCLVSAGYSDLRTGDGGGNGANPGGAGGYSGNGGLSQDSINGAPSQSGSGGGGGGGGLSANGGICVAWRGAGGGVGLFGQGASGAGGSGWSNVSGGPCSTGVGGGGGSGGTAGGNSTLTTVGNGGLYGGGQGEHSVICGQTGGSSAIRIIWPGNTRQFPSTCTANK